MVVHNSEIADIFATIADLLELEGANPFRIRAYRNAAQTISNYSHSLADMVKAKNDLTQLPSIGKDLATQIQEIVTTGTCRQLKQARKAVPAVLLELMQVKGLGAKRIKRLHKELKIKSMRDMQRACKQHLIRELSGFGDKVENLICEAITQKIQGEHRFRIDEIRDIAKELTTYLQSAKNVKKVEIAGSYRRHKETVGDLDILAITNKPTTLMLHFVKFPKISKILSKGNTRATVILKSGLQIDLRVIPEISYGAALLYFTGSKMHNIACREIALKKGLKLNEYGLFKGEKRLSSKTEQAIYNHLGLSYIEPELRENTGEIAAAQQGKLPKLN